MQRPTPSSLSRRPQRPEAAGDPARGSQAVPPEGLRGHEHGRGRALAEASKVTIYKHFSDKQQPVHCRGDRCHRRGQGRARRHWWTSSATAPTSSGTYATSPASTRARHAAPSDPDAADDHRRGSSLSGPGPGLAPQPGPSGPTRPLPAKSTGSSQRGLLQVPDPLLAAQLLNYLILSVPLNEAMFTGRDKPYSRRYLNRYADEAVRVFLAAYGPGRKGRRTR